MDKKGRVHRLNSVQNIMILDNAGFHFSKLAYFPHFLLKINSFGVQIFHHTIYFKTYLYKKIKIHNLIKLIYLQVFGLLVL